MWCWICFRWWSMHPCLVSAQVLLLTKINIESNFKCDFDFSQFVFQCRYRSGTGQSCEKSRRKPKIGLNWRRGCTAFTQFIRCINYRCNASTRWTNSQIGPILAQIISQNLFSIKLLNINEKNWDFFTIIIFLLYKNIWFMFIVFIFVLFNIFRLHSTQRKKFLFANLN